MKRGLVAAALLRQEERGINNLFTGYKLRAGASAGLIIGGLAAGIAMGFKEDRMDQRSTRTTEVGQMASMGYDAVANGSMRTGDRSLGATGDIVFGLNSSRKGGF